MQGKFIFSSLFICLVCHTLYGQTLLRHSIIYKPANKNAKRLKTAILINQNIKTGKYTTLAEIDSFNSYSATGAPTAGSRYLFSHDDITNQDTIYSRFLISSYCTGSAYLEPGWPGAMDWQMASFTEQNYTGQSWINKTRGIAVIDSDNNLTDNILQKWDGTGWVNTERETRIYHADDIDTVVTLKWDGSQWENYKRSANFYFRGFSTGFFFEKWYANSWHADSLYKLSDLKMEYTIGKGGNIISAYKYGYDMARGWQQLIRENYFYDGNNNLHGAIRIRSNSSGNIAGIDTFVNIKWQHFEPISNLNNYNFTPWYKSYPFMAGGYAFLSFDQQEWSPDSGREISILSERQTFNADLQSVRYTSYKKDVMNTLKTEDITTSYYPEGHPEKTIDSTYNPGNKRLEVNDSIVYEITTNADSNMTSRLYKHYNVAGGGQPYTNKYIFIYDTATSITPEKAGQRISIFPNPASTQLFVSSQNDIIKSISVFDAAGKLLGTENAREYIAVMDVSAFPPGMYILLVTTDNGTGTYKFLK